MKKKIDDIRIQEFPFSFDGRDYLLRCNMSVIADIQEACDGDLLFAVSKASTYKTVCMWLAAMMNNYAEREGFKDYVPFTARSLGNKLAPNQVPINEIMALVANALTIDPDESDSADQHEAAEKN